MALVTKDGVTIETPPRTPTAGDVLAMAEFLKAYVAVAGDKQGDEKVLGQMGRVMNLWCNQFGAPAAGE